MSSKHECGSIAAERCPNEEPEGSAASAGVVVVPNTSCCFSVLPHEILQMILRDYVDRDDKKSLVRLASCNKFLQRLVYREFSFLWESIELPINDSQLRALLERVNARHVTKHISFRSFWRGQDISGSGLVPLMNSKVLESADLRLRVDYGKIYVGPTGLDDTFVASIFRSMLPYKLDSVKLRPQEEQKQDDYGAIVPFGEYCTPWAELLKSLHLKKARKLLKELMSCSHCGTDFSELNPSTQTILNTCSARCVKCEEATCRVWNANTSSCPTTQECDWCLDAFCQSCLPVLGCHRCGTKSCTECCEVMDCTDCGVAKCTNCSCGEVFPCDRCSGRYCDRCRWVRDCNVCKEWICEDCWLCSEKGMNHACSSCLESQGGQCLGCDLVVGCCQRDEDVMKCNNCGITDDRIICGRCWRSRCYQFTSLKKCGGCSKLYCEDCNDHMPSCMSCGKRFCGNCDEIALSCDKCDEITCKGCLEANGGLLKCDACQKLCVVRCRRCLKEQDRRVQTGLLLCMRCRFVCDPCACETCGELLCGKDRDRFRNTCDDSYCCGLPTQDKHNCLAEPNGQTSRRKKKKVI